MRFLSSRSHRKDCFVGCGVAAFMAGFSVLVERGFWGFGWVAEEQEPLPITPPMSHSLQGSL